MSQDPAGATPPDPTDALLAEAASKSGFLWLRPLAESGARAWPAWHVWHDAAVHLVTGPGEQPLPALDGDLELLLRSKDTGARLLTFPARAQALDPAGDAWSAAAAALAASRLNSSHSPAELPEHWRAAGVQVVRVEVIGAALEHPGQYGESSHAAPPAPTAATTSGWRPWHARGRPARRWARRRTRGR